MNESLKEKIFQSIGEASMCWSETPRGIFNSTKAKEIGEDLVNAIEVNKFVKGEEVLKILEGLPHDIVLPSYYNPKYPEKGELLIRKVRKTWYVGYYSYGEVDSPIGYEYKHINPSGQFVFMETESEDLYDALCQMVEILEYRIKPILEEELQKELERLKVLSPIIMYIKVGIGRVPIRWNIS